MTENEAERQEPDDDVVIDALLQTHYTYLGQDAEGFHHHYNDLESTVYVTTEDAEKTVVNHRPRWTVSGGVDHVEDLGQYDDRGLEEWAEFVDEERGWESFDLTLIGFPKEAAEILAPDRREAI